MYKVTDAFKLRASVGRAFRAPDLVKLYGGWRMGPYMVQPNPDLDPETSIGYQVGAEYQFSKDYLAKVSLFRNEVEDMISSRIVRRGPPPWDMYWENIDEATTQGVEADLVARLTDNLTAKLAYTYLDTEDEETNKELIERANHKVDLELNWKILELGLNVNITGQYFGRRYEDAENTNKLGDYTLWDLALTKDITKYAEAFVRIDNIFGEENIVDEYDIDGTEFLGGLQIMF
jgi:outer membrane cobalamin receptor